MDYRREIDGLRALAVLPVILFHAGFETFSGGFVGVDVFFVISGYLIATIILTELEQGRFSIVTFYERRARRILPALFLVMLVCIPFAWFWLLPTDLKDFSQSLVAVSVFAPNILFWHESGYFDAAAELKPLLHTWSLAVEEQYYVLFPLFLMLFWKLGKRWILVTLALVFLASLAAAEWGAQNKPAAAFYLLPTRGWELLIGAFAAFYLSQANRNEFGKGRSELCGWLGVALILYAIFAYSKTTPFPGFYVLVPTLGTVLIILFATQQTTVGKFVGNKVLVGVGLISYSAYLWHQPLFAFARNRSLLEPNQHVFLALSILALVLAYFSWRFVETPFRKKSFISRRSVFLSSLVGSLLFILLGLYGHFSNGKFAERTNSSHINDLDLRVKVNHGLSIDCEGDYNVSPNCSTSDKPEVILWGDSYAMHLAQGFIASNPSVGLVQKTVSACGPFLGIAPTNAQFVRSWAEKCLSINDQVFEYLRQTPSIKYVVLSSPFGQFVGSDASVLTKDGRIVNGKAVAVDAMKDTLNKIRSLGKTPVIFSPTPQNGENVARCLMKAIFFNESAERCNVRYADSLKRQSDVWSFLKEIGLDVRVVYLTDFLCRDDTCRASLDDVFIYRDGGHLAHEGSAYLGAKMNFYQILVDAEKSGK
jgi:peptidoglycan/LPS O-acetylase OafA/YrhL